VNGPAFCMQVEQHLRAIAGPCGIGSAAIVGGLSAVKQVPLLPRRFCIEVGITACTRLSIVILSGVWLMPAKHLVCPVGRPSTCSHSFRRKTFAMCSSQERVLSRKPALVAATPGRLWDLMQDGTGAAAHLTQLASLDFLVLDEADRMVQQGHYQASRRMKWLALLDAMHP